MKVVVRSEPFAHSTAARATDEYIQSVAIYIYICICVEPQQIFAFKLRNDAKESRKVKIDDVIYVLLV